MSSLDRKSHALKREKSLIIPRHFIFFDTETTQIEQGDGSVLQEFKLGWAVYYRRRFKGHAEQVIWQYLPDMETFWRFVFAHTMPKQRLWIIARNVVFDFTICKGWKHLKSEGYKLRFFHNNGVSAIVTVKKDNKSIVFLDSMNWFTESLAKTGERIGIPKRDIDFDTCTMQELSEYCRNDVRIEFENYKIFIKFLEHNMIGRLCYTKASTAMAAYLFRHYNHKIYIHNNAEACQLERESYKGGRCECFYIGELNHENYYILDVNSLYPFVMANNPYPTKYKKILHKPGLSKVKDCLHTDAMVCRVQVKTDKPAYAVKRERTMFPIGTFTVTLCTPEIKYALEHGHITKVYDMVTYEQADIFTSYVNTMYALRREFKDAGVREYEQLCKYLLNSLYGKFGQKAEQWSLIGDAPNEPDREEMILHEPPKKATRIRYLLGQVWELTGHGEAYNSFPAISSHVTAYGRMYLWKIIQTCGYGNVFYCDTDSVMVNEQGLANLEPYCNDTELGKLKLERTATHITIRGLKDYTIDGTVKLKGVRRNAVKVADNEYRQEQWPSFRGLLKSDDVDTYRVKTITKHLNREYHKGNVSDTGTVTPFIL